MDEELDFFVRDCFAEPGIGGTGTTNKEKLILIEHGQVSISTFFYISIRLIPLLNIISFQVSHSGSRAEVDSKPNSSAVKRRQNCPPSGISL